MIRVACTFHGCFSSTTGVLLPLRPSLRVPGKRNARYSRTVVIAFVSVCRFCKQYRLISMHRHNGIYLNTVACMDSLSPLHLFVTSLLGRKRIHVQVWCPSPPVRILASYTMTLLWAVLHHTYPCMLPMLSWIERAAFVLSPSTPRATGAMYVFHSFPLPVVQLNDKTKVFEVQINVFLSIDNAGHWVRL